jgi:hypothetical protein
MPYITSDRRARYDERLNALNETIDDSTPGGDINYIVTSVLAAWIEKRGLSYAALAEAVGVIETSKLELYRRVAAPYEDDKIAENGDVYARLEGTD